MSYKAISIVIDDFSSRSDELDGVFVYDYGVVDSYLIKDFYLQDGSGKGDFEGEFDQILFQGSEYKYEISEYWDKENYNLISQGNISEINGYLYDEIEVNVASGLTPYVTEDPEHGDIVVESFLNQLDDPNQSLIIAIEYPPSLSEFSNDQFYEIVKDFLINYTLPDDEIFFIGLNASFGLDGSILEGMSELILDLFNEDLIVVQASPNANAPIQEINWSEVYPNVINVGAWNNENDGEFVGTTSDSMPTVDIYADGYVQSSIWDDNYQNFGTSFASPVVLAEIHNWFINNIIPKYESGEYLYSPQINLPDNVYENALDEVLDFISTDLVYRIPSEEIHSGPIKVLTDDVENGNLDPQVIPYDIPRLVPAIELEDIQLFSDDDILTDFNLDLFPSLEAAENLNDVDEFMSLIENYVDKDIFNISANDSEYFHVGANDQVFLNGPETKISLINGDNASLNLISGNSLVFSKGDNLTVNDMGSGGVVYFELEDKSNINLNVSSSGLKLLIGDKVFNETTSVELINNKVFINDNETGINVSFSDNDSFIEIQDIYGNSNQLRSLQKDIINIDETEIVIVNSQDSVVSSDETNTEITEITIFDEQSYVSNSTEFIEENFPLNIDKNEEHHEISGNFGIDDDLFIDDDDLNELISNDNNMISNNSVQMVDLEGQEFSLNLTGDDTISVEELSDSTEVVFNIEDYDRNFEEIMDEVLFATGLDSFFWDDEIDLISET